eukprot:COSAG01_NODE_1217_length_11190_cov_69.180417_15_plen_212_part_00
MQNELWHILGILSIRPVRPDYAARARCWREGAPERAASRPHHQHRDLIVTYIISTYYHRHRAERAAPLVSEQTRPPSNPCDQILSESSTQPSSSPARQDASTIQPVRPGPLHHQRFSIAGRHPHPPRRHRRHRHPVIGHLYDISIYDISRSSACSCSSYVERITASVHHRHRQHPRQQRHLERAPQVLLPHVDERRWPRCIRWLGGVVWNE